MHHFLGKKISSDLQSNQDLTWNEFMFSFRYPLKKISSNQFFLLFLIRNLKTTFEWADIGYYKKENGCNLVQSGIGIHKNVDQL